MLPVVNTALSNAHATLFSPPNNNIKKMNACYKLQIKPATMSLQHKNPGMDSCGEKVCGTEQNHNKLRLFEFSAYAQ